MMILDIMFFVCALLIGFMGLWIHYDDGHSGRQLTLLANVDLLCIFALGYLGYNNYTWAVLGVVATLAGQISWAVYMYIKRQNKETSL
jgi:hypothetical protein